MRLSRSFSIALGVLVLGTNDSLASDDDMMTFFQADRLEYREDGWLWDAQGWIGGDYHKLWWKTEGELGDDSDDEAELQLLYSRAYSAFFDLQFGLRHDIDPQPSRTYLVAGFQGLAPQWIEIDAAAFISEEGDFTARIEAEYELLLTQRLVLQPRFEIELAAQEVSELHIGSGITSTELGLRLRYEIRREVAPYIGLSWRESYGGTADLLQAAGEDDDSLSVVAGIRLWF